MADQIEGIDLKDLDNLFAPKPSDSGTTSSGRLYVSPEKDKIEGINLKDLDAAFSAPPSSPMAATKSTPSKTDVTDYSTVTANPDIASGIWQGIKDIPNTGAQAIGFLDRNLAKILPTGGEERAKAYEERLAAENAALPTDNPAFNFGRGTGQVLATAPLMPVSAFQGINAAAKAIPYAGKIVGPITSGALAGGIFGGATNSSNDEGLASNVGTGAGYGAIAGPIAEAGAQVAGRVVSGAKNIIQSVKTNNILKNSGIDPGAAQNILQRLSDAGYTPAQAHAELQQLGSQATLADLSPSLTTEAGGLASKGGVPTETLKGRYGERANDANDVAHDIMQTKLGAKPDYEIEKEIARQDRISQTSADYNKAKASNMALDVRPIALDIKDQLDHAVGSEATELHNIGSYLFDSKGNIKTDTAPLLKVRQALDDRLDRLPREGTTQKSTTYRAVAKIRSDLDAVLKQNPDLAIADAKYAKLAEDAKGIDRGKEVLANNGNFDKFEREFSSASPEKQEYMRKGLRIYIGDQMEKATRGELPEAQRLFGKSTKNRDAIELAFGGNGSDVLDALEKEAKFRATEHSIKANSLTAERRAVQERPEYGGAKFSTDYFSHPAAGLALDVATGTPGVGTALGVGKDILSSKLAARANAQSQKTIEGSADLLSRQAKHGNASALDLLGRIPARNVSKLPIDYSGVVGRIGVPATIPIIKKAKNSLSKLVGVSEQ